MSEVKIVQGVIPYTKADENTRVVVDNNFSVVVPKGMRFSTDQNVIGGDKILAMFLPASDAEELGDDSFVMQYGNAQIRVRFNTEVHEYGRMLDLNDAGIRKELTETFVKSIQGAVGQYVSGLGDDTSDLVFVVKSDEKAVVVAASQGFWGNATFVLALPFCYYTGMYYIANGTDMDSVREHAAPAVYKETAKKLLSTIEAWGDNAVAISKDDESAPLLVSELRYTQNKRVTVGTISVPIPDGTICALCEATDEVDAVIPRNLRSNMDFMCVPVAYPRGFGAYQDASISIFFRKPTLENNLEQAWDSHSVDDVASQLIQQFESSMNKQAMTQAFKIVQKEKGFLSCYCLFSGDNAQECFWRSYTFYIVTGGISVTGMFYFNQKASDSEFEAVVKHWLSEVHPVSGAISKNIVATLAKEKLGPYAAENGKLDAILIARLFAEDVLFFPETPLERKGNKLNLNPQFNAEKQGEHPFIMQNSQAFFSALGDLFIQLDTRKELQVPKSQIHPEMLKPLLDDRLTGLSFLNLMAYHMVKIVEKDDEKDDGKDIYMVIVDQNVIAGIPEAYHYICKFIRFAREYNEKPGAFVVRFASAINFDSPISGTLTPVEGADVVQPTGTGKGVWGFMVEEDGKIWRRYTIEKKVTFSEKSRRDQQAEDGTIIDDSGGMAENDGTITAGKKSAGSSKKSRSNQQAKQESKRVAQSVQRGQQGKETTNKAATAVQKSVPVTPAGRAKAYADQCRDKLKQELNRRTESEKRNLTGKITALQTERDKEEKAEKIRREKEKAALSKNLKAAKEEHDALSAIKFMARNKLSKRIEEMEQQSAVLERAIQSPSNEKIFKLTAELAEKEEELKMQIASSN